MRTPVFLLRLCLCMLLVTGNAGCQAGSIAEAASDDTVSRADRLLRDLPASGKSPQQRLLTAAMLYGSGQAYAKARETLNRIDTAQLERDQRGDYLVTAADTALGMGDLEEAWRVLARPPAGRHDFIDTLSPLDYARVAERRARVLERRGQWPDAARERIGAAPALPADMRRANTDALWETLLRMNRTEREALQQLSAPLPSGWAALANAWQETEGTPPLRAARIDAWLRANPNHPAASQPPAAITRLLRDSGAIATGPATIAVLLPQHGKLAAAGNAVQRGIIAAWYEAREHGLQVPALQFHDSSRSDFAATYTAAVSAGARFVIGPLEKENLRNLQQFGNMPAATLALNYPDSDTTVVRGLFYFGLAGEDEAQQAAQALVRAGLPRAIVLAPDADWGQRIARQFEQTLLAQGGRVQAIGTYKGNGDYSDVVRRLLDAGASEQRHARLERLFGSKLLFQPRRRQDIDALFMIANTPQAVQLAPSVQYHYGDGLPIIATSHINSQANANALGDLNAIRFLEMPWIHDVDNVLRARVNEIWRDTDERYFRLYGLGVDAFRVSQHLVASDSDMTFRLDGVTGALSMESDNRIRRQLSWLIFRDRQAVNSDAP